MAASFTHKEGTAREVQPAVLAALAQRLATHAFASAEQARRWLNKEHGVARPTRLALAKKRRECCACRARGAPF